MKPISSPDAAPNRCAATDIFGSEFPRVKQWLITNIMSLMQSTMTEAMRK